MRRSRFNQTAEEFDSREILTQAYGCIIAPAGRSYWKFWMKASSLCYDPVAEFYDRVLVPRIFTAPARDLILLLRLAPESTVLDVGTGTGIAASEARKVVGPGGTVVGLDPSLAMLRLARSKDVRNVVAGMVPGLPFAEGLFEGVVASFVLSHVADYRAALADMARTLRPSGSLAVSTWGPTDDELNHAWEEQVRRFANLEALRDRTREALPWAEWFTDGNHLREALLDTGLAGVEVRQHEYAVSVSLADHLTDRKISIQGRMLAQLLGAANWKRFQQQVQDAFQSHFPDPLEYRHSAWLAAGVKPLIRAK